MKKSQQLPQCFRTPSTSLASHNTPGSRFVTHAPFNIKTKNLKTWVASNFQKAIKSLCYLLKSKKGDSFKKAENSNTKVYLHAHRFLLSIEKRIKTWKILMYYRLKLLIVEIRNLDERYKVVVKVSDLETTFLWVTYNKLTLFIALTRALLFYYTISKHLFRKNDTIPWSKRFLNINSSAILTIVLRNVVFWKTTILYCSANFKKTWIFFGSSVTLCRGRFDDFSTAKLQVY